MTEAIAPSRSLPDRLEACSKIIQHVLDIIHQPGTEKWQKWTIQILPTPVIHQEEMVGFERPFLCRTQISFIIRNTI
jgi:hypothetical protein